jgi:LPS O-antigen subunit length determinant protein (WzzB/FepE family)
VIKNQQLTSPELSDTALLVLITSELQQYRTRISSIEERLTITLPTEEDAISQKITKNVLVQNTQKLAIREAELNVANVETERVRKIKLLSSDINKIAHDIEALPVTQAIAEPARSLEPINNKKKKLIIVIALIIGLLVGLFSSLLAAFLNKVKKEELT